MAIIIVLLNKNWINHRTMLSIIEEYQWWIMETKVI
jgi:hypothetical protein